MRTSILMAGVGLALSLGVTACSGGGGDDPGPDPAVPGPTPVAKLSLKNFPSDDNCAGFLSYAADALTEQYLQPFYRCYGDGLVACPLEIAPPPSSTDLASAPAESASPDRVSGTNTQEAGVDEADIVKADAAGNLYLLSGRYLHILDAFPPAGLEQRPLASLDLSVGSADFYANDFLLDEQNRRAVIFGQRYDAQTPLAEHLIVDVSDATAPRIEQRLGVTGWSLESRRIASRVHRVLRYDVPQPAWFYESGDPLDSLRRDYLSAVERGDDAAAARIKNEVRQEVGSRVNAAGAQSLLPRLRQGSTETVLSCGAIARPEVPMGLGLALIDSFDTDGSDRATAAAVNNAWLVYASTQNLYLAQSSFGWRFAPGQTEETAIYRFSLGAQGAAVYEGVGTVPGSVQNSYAFGEFEGRLHVASTETRFDGAQRPTPYNHLYVLRADQAGADLSVTGSVRDFAPGERVQGSRFLGDRGFVVTFRQIDPLFAFDLSDSAQPRIASELKIPGFSTYLAPVGEEYLLTVGREGDDAGTTGRMQVSLFDVRDLRNVHQIAKLVPDGQPAGYSYSIAEYDPHAFAYFADTETAASPGRLTIPFTSYGERADEQFSGFIVIRVDPAAATPLIETGRVDHQSLAQDEFCGDAANPCQSAIYAAEPRRAVFMQDDAGTYLYTLSLAGVLASDAAQPSTELGRKSLPYDPPAYWGCCVVVN